MYLTVRRSKPVSLVVVLLAFFLWALVSALPIFSAGEGTAHRPLIGLPAGAGPSAAPSAVSDSEPLVQQFTAAGHVLGFGETEVYLAGIGHALRLEFVGGSAVVPLTESGGPAENGVAPLDQVHYSDTWVLPQFGV